VTASSTTGTALHARRQDTSGAVIEARLATPTLAADFSGDVTMSGTLAIGASGDSSPSLRARPGGGLELRAARPGDQIDLRRDGGSFARLSITAETVVARPDDGVATLQMDVAAGNLGVGRGVTPLTALHLPERGLQIGASANAGDNFHWISDVNGGARGLRLYNGNHGSGTHLLTVSRDGRIGVNDTNPGYALTVAGDIATVRGIIHTGHLDGSSAATDEVIGAIGFVGPGVQHGQLSFRAGRGFELVDRSQDGPNLGYARDSHPYADLTLRNLDVRGTVTLQHNLSAGGDLSISGHLKLSQQVMMQANQAISSTGRLHITGEELLYILNKSGVIVGKEWGGNGNLRAQGGIRVDTFLATNGLATTNNGPGDAAGPGFPSWSGGGINTFDVVARGALYVGTNIEDPQVQIYSNGVLIAKDKRFRIDHPLNPERHLVHASLEGPETGVYYRGEAQLDAGEAVVTLPAYFEALTRDEGTTVMITPILDEHDQASALAVSAVRAGAFRVRATDVRNPAQRFYWEVKAVRADLEPLQVEVEKSTREVPDDYP
ncbi:MAG: hypothetical protein ACRDTA_06580, partial [Pseudonocardiaceae bacterium]